MTQPRLTERTFAVTEPGIELPVVPGGETVWISESLLFDIARSTSFDADLVARSQILRALVTAGLLDVETSRFGIGVVTPALFDLLGVDRERVHFVVRPRPRLDHDGARFARGQNLAFRFGPEQHRGPFDHDAFRTALL